MGIQAYEAAEEFPVVDFLGDIVNNTDLTFMSELLSVPSLPTPPEASATCAASFSQWNTYVKVLSHSF